jgi:hypothetical protein
MVIFLWNLIILTHNAMNNKIENKPVVRSGSYTTVNDGVKSSI